MIDCLIRVLRHIEKNIDRRLRLVELASVCGKSTERFRHLFKAATGVSPHAYVMRRRVAAARRMIKAGNGSLADVAYACGFGSQARFTVVFKAMTGVTPGAFKKSLQASILAVSAAFFSRFEAALAII